MTKDLKVNSIQIAIKQFFAFCIDFIIVSLPLLIYPSLESFAIFAIVWFLYIPLSEYFFSQTIGMKILGTKIYASSKPLSKVRFITVLRRQIARISLFWGIIGWLSLLSGQFFKDYTIVYDDSVCSHDEKIEEELLGFVKGAKYSMGVVYSLMGWSIK
jgi:hypothetical protein